MIIGILCIVLVVIIASAYLLIPLPLLSYQQGGVKIGQGEVTEVKNVRLGVLEVSLRQGMEIDPHLQQGDVEVISASITRLVYFRKGQPLPKTGDKISVSSISRRYRFTGRSFNWVKEWELLKSGVPVGGKVRLVTV